jgi:hypothetical protein
LFVDTSKYRGSTRFWLEWGWIRDVRNFAYTKRKCVSDFFGEWGGFGFRGVYWFVCDVGWMSRIMVWPNVNANSLLVTCRDFEFGISYEGVESLVLTDEEPQVVDEFEG